jgi:hypothetical protein
MQYFVVDTDWDENLNSPWDALWHEGEYNALGCLDGSKPLKAIWKSPEITLESRDKIPDVYSFELHFAVKTVPFVPPAVWLTRYKSVRDGTENAYAALRFGAITGCGRPHGLGAAWFQSEMSDFRRGCGRWTAEKPRLWRAWLRVSDKT